MIQRLTNRMNTFMHGIAFVAGFSLIFIALGVTVSVLGGILYDLRPYIAKFGGVIIILFGLHMTGILRIPYLDYELRPQFQDGSNAAPCLHPLMIGNIFLCGMVSMCRSGFRGYFDNCPERGFNNERFFPAFKLLPWDGDSVFTGRLRDWLGHPYITKT